MSHQPPALAGEITRLLKRSSTGDDAAVNKLYELIYGELHRIAQAHLAQPRGSATLQPTILVHEAWLRLEKAGPGRVSYADREHFLSVASRAMRSALVDHARRRAALKREPGGSRQPFEVVLELHGETGIDMVALDEALERLADEMPRQARVVELRFFGGLTLVEVARTLGVSKPTIDRDWLLARMFLREELRGA